MAEKSLIVYYSWVGNTEVAAKEIQAQTGFGIQKIEEIKERKKSSIGSSAMSAFFGFKSSIKPVDFSMKGYRNIILGAQVWAGKTTPAINSFLGKADFKDKKVWLFITKADEKIPQKVIDSIKSRIEKKGGKVMDCLSLTTKWDPKTNIPVSAEEVRSNITDWIKKIKVSL